MIGMPDREKISGFELCANGKPCIGEKFMKCPFSPRNNSEPNCGVTMARFALALLKEQEPVKPFKEGYNDYDCSRCGAGLRATDRYCPNCGRMVKWNEL